MEEKPREKSLEELIEEVKFYQFAMRKAVVELNKFRNRLNNKKEEVKE